MDKLVSVVIPFYSGKQWLKEALESVFNQSYEHLEVVLINDGSKEDISELILEYQEEINYFQTENHGAAAARNYGIKQAQGEYIAFLDSDDLWEPDKIRKQVEYMNQHLDICWCITSYDVFDDQTGKIIKSVKCNSFQGDVFPKILYSSPIATPTVMVRNMILKEYGIQFEENLRYGEDSCLWIQLSLLSPLACINESLALVRWRGSNAANDVIGQIASRSKVYNEMLKYPYFTSNTYKIHKLAMVSMKYCEWMYHYLIVEKKITNKSILKMLYFPARLCYKVLSKV